MIKRPQFKTCYDIIDIPNNGIILVSETDSKALFGKVFSALHGLLNGQNNIDQILEKLFDRITPAEVFYAIQQLEELGYIQESMNDSNMVTNFYDLIQRSYGVPKKRLDQIKIDIRNYSKVPDSIIIKKLNSNGIYNTNQDVADLTVVLVDDYLNPVLETINEEMLEKDSTWILSKPLGTTIWVGPLFKPFNTGCYHCLSNRLGHNQLYHFLARKSGVEKTIDTSKVYLPFSIDIGLGLLLSRVLTSYLPKENHALADALITFDTLTLETKHHVLTKRPQCSQCGKQHHYPKPFMINSNQHSSQVMGRSIDSETMFAKLEHHISPLTGIVRNVDNELHFDKPGVFRLMQSTHLFRSDSYKINEFFYEVTKSSGGKGETLLEAKLGTVCEALERYSGTYQGDEERIKASYRDIQEQAINVNDCMLFSDRQFRLREELNKQATRMNFIPEMLPDDEIIQWTPVWSLTGEKFKYFATSYCFYGGDENDRRFMSCNSNGTATGGTLEEAVLYGFLELIERDAVSIWWFNRIKRPQVDMDSFKDPFVDKVQEYYSSIGRSLWIIDISNDLGIPVFAAISCNVKQKSEDIIYGFGAHFDPRIALRGALMELNQTLPLVMNKNSDGSTKYMAINQDCMRWWNSATLENQPYLVPSAEKINTILDYKKIKEDNYSLIQRCTLSIKKIGLEAYVLDQTRPDIGLHVAKVIVPGLRHFWSRFAPGRLYDVPVNLGWLKDKNNELSMNQYPIFF